MKSVIIDDQNTSPIRTISLAILVGLLLANFVSGLAWAVGYDDLFDSTLYPAKVQSIDFSGGSRIDNASCVGWGNWDACFGPSSPIARYQYVIPPIGRRNHQKIISIGLRCRNKIEGEIECGMSLFQGVQDSNLNGCLMVIQNNPISIDCPRGIRFE